MAITVNFYDFAKRQNSTAQPAVSDLVSQESCTLKAPTDMIRPIILLEHSGAPTGMTYAQIPSFSRYYWIRSWRSVNAGLWEADLEEDFLATWKGAIGSASKYVLRSASAYNGDIIDSSYPAKSTRRQIECTTTDSSPFNLSNVSIVLGIIGSGTNSMAGVQYYSFTPAQLAALMTDVFDATIYNVTDFTQDLQKMIFNPLQYVSSAMLFPFSVSAYGTTTNSIKFGWWDFPSTPSLSPVATLLSSTPNAIINSPNYTIAKHPQAATRGAYLNGAPFSSYYMTFPGIGIFDLDPAQLIDGDTLSTLLYVDLISGKGLLRSTVQSGGSPLRQLRPRFGQIGVPITLAQIGRDPSVLSLAREGGGQILSALGNFVGGKIGQIVNGVGDAVQADARAVESQGSTGALTEYLSTYAMPRMYLMYSNVVDRDLTEFGAPLCEVKTISTLSGFVQCADGDLTIKAFPEERQTIERHMTSGFFYL